MEKGQERHQKQNYVRGILSGITYWQVDFRDRNIKITTSAI